MTTNTKGTVKSCRCWSCKHARHSSGGHVISKSEQHAARQRDRIALKKDPLEAVIAPAHRGDRIG